MSGRTRSITAGVAAFVSATPSDAIPDAARLAGVRSIVDTIGVLLAGVSEPVVRMVADLVGPATGPATLLGLGRRASAADAALVNATAAHAIDYDDVHSHVRGHPSACVLPAALAAAEHAGRGGAGLLDAYLIGIEVAARVGRGIGPSHAAQGFHSTAILGVLGAAAAASRALGLDAERTAAALGIAASSAGGLRRNFGTMTKPLHAGYAARDGVTAALLGRAGVTAAPDVLDPPGSFVDVYCPGGDADAEAIRDFGNPWEIVDPGMAIKKYPCCNRGHRALDAVLDIVRLHDVRADDVESIEVRMPSGQVDAGGRVGPMTFPRPATGLEAKFSMPYVIAAAVADRGLPLAAFTDDGMRRPVIAALLPRVHPVNRADAQDHVEVVLTTRAGHRHRSVVRFAGGDPRGGEPLGWDDVVAKYTDCASTVLTPAAVGRSAALVRLLDSLDDVRELTGMLVGEAVG
ncbi:MAG TPA: MmgE/PrpD family protein [Pseudonocardiaceae bacterium]|nr:MmgE/PrpD family protein [Pseudonocardiaceae bacterium]